MDEEELYGSSSEAFTCGVLNCGKVVYPKDRGRSPDKDHILPKAFFPEKTDLEENLRYICEEHHKEKTRKENQIRDLHRDGFITLQERQSRLFKNSVEFYGEVVWEL